MKWKPETLRGAFLPIAILNWLCGFSAFEYPLGKPRFVLSVLYLILTTSAYCYAYSHDPFTHIPDDNNIRTKIFIILKCVNFFISTCCILINWYKYKEYKIMIQRMEMLNRALESLDLPNENGKIFINSLLKTFIWIIMVVCLISMDMVIFLEIFDLAKTLHISYVFHYPIQINSVVDLTFTSIVHCIGLKFDSINLFLKRILLLNPKTKIVNEWYRKRNRINTLVMSPEQSNVLNNEERQKALIILIKHIHMELTNISYQVNGIYQTQMTMIIGACLISITAFFYTFFTLILFVNQAFFENTKPIIGTIAWCAIYTYRFLKVNSICTRVSLKSRKTRNILCEIKNAIQNQELKKEIEQFSLQLTQRPLIFTVCGFSTSDFTFFRRFIAKVMTCLVILLQQTVEKEPSE